MSHADSLTVNQQKQCQISFSQMTDGKLRVGLPPKCQ